eukprot:1572733-Heterocapsa_arctica.AAC.1
MEAYMEGRGASLPDAPDPRIGDISGAILKASGSAPGSDNVPYEVYHYGVHFTAHLLGQALHASARGAWHLARVLGSNVDLLLWIPQKAGAEHTDGQRPLQLPSCFRRLFGSVVMSIVGPAVEPQLTPRQASVRGGSCGPNITRAYEHLAG